MVAMFRVFFTTLLITYLSVFLITPFAFAQSRIGVGVGTGKIVLDEELLPGKRYELPPLNVINTGDVETEYEVTITYHEQQAELRPELQWFTFTPSSFKLKPGEVKNVNIALTLPLQLKPEKYFAYLEAHPIRKTAEGGGTAVNVAAAAKLYFTVKPANMFQAVFYRVSSLYTQYKMPFWVIVGAGLLYAIFRVLRKYIHLDIKLKQPNTKQSHDDHEKKVVKD
jgi:hypothetical protein